MSFNNRKETTIDILEFKLTNYQHKLVTSNIIGKSGSNIAQISKQIPGIYIRLFNTKKGKDIYVPGEECDSIYIAGRTEKCISKCIQLIKNDIQSIISTNKPTNKHTTTFKSPDDLVGYIIGRQGVGLKNIQQKCGNGCFIIYDKDIHLFKISAFTKTTLKRAILYLEDTIQTYYDQKLKIKKSPTMDYKKSPTHSYNSFDILSYDEDDEETHSFMDQEQFPTLPYKSIKQQHNKKKQCWNNTTTLNKIKSSKGIQELKQTPDQKQLHTDNDDEEDMINIYKNISWADMCDDESD